MLLRKCYLCQQKKPLTSKYFWKNKSKTFGFERECKECGIKRFKIKRNKPGYKEKIKKYQVKNKERIKIYERNWYLKNRKKALQYSKEYQIKHPKERKKWNKKWRNKKGIGILTLRFQILKRDNFTCQYCGRKAPEVELQIDHKYPKSKGGENKEENYITACSDCNYGKRDILLDFKNTIDRPS